MPSRDPDRKKATDAAAARAYRARKKQAKMGASVDQTPPASRVPPTSPLLPLSKGPMGQVVDMMANLTPVEWTSAKGRIAAELLNKAQARLETMDVSTLTPPDVLRYLQAGIVLMQAVQVEESERRERGSETFDLAAAVLRHPRARALVLELARLSRELRGQGELGG